MKPLLNKVDAVLFDLDGTLVDTNIDFPLMKRRMIELASEQGIASSALANLDILAIVDYGVDFLISLGSREQAARLRETAMMVLEDMEMRHARATQQIPFARELVATLSSNAIKTGIVTRNCRKASELSLKIVKVEPDVLICREDAARHKPHPEPLRLALDRLGVCAEASIMIGDHIMDIMSGKAAGMKTIGILRGERPDDFFAQIKPDFVTRDLREVLCAIIRCDR